MMKHTAQWMVLAASLGIMVSGCGGNSMPAPGGGSAKVESSQKSSEPAFETTAKAGHDHSGWWCNEHGVPEEECALCSSKLAAEFQKKGDWCKEHDRPDSQCFKCHPELQAKFAAKYEAKFGKKPPEPEMN